MCMPRKIHQNSHTYLYVAVENHLGDSDKSPIISVLKYMHDRWGVSGA